MDHLFPMKILKMNFNSNLNRIYTIFKNMEGAVLEDINVIFAEVKLLKLKFKGVPIDITFQKVD